MFTLKIKTDNAAFADGNAGLELARILREIADGLEDSPPEDFDGKVMDANGNCTGTVKCRL